MPSLKPYEADRTKAMIDINSFYDGYCLVLTKSHFVNLLDANPTDLAEVLPTSQIVARAMEAAQEPGGIILI